MHTKERMKFIGKLIILCGSVVLGVPLLLAEDWSIVE